MDEKNLKKIKYKIHGMHCSACEVLIERKFKNIDGIKKVVVNEASGCAEVFCTDTPSLDALEDSVKKHGYRVTHWSDKKEFAELRQNNTQRDYFEIGALFLILLGLYLIFRQWDIIPKNIGISDNMGFGVVFLIGLVAAVSSCIAVTGGLLLAVAARYNEKYPEVSQFQKFKPHLYFNGGRILSYTVFGALIGQVGSFMTFSSRATGILSLAASLVMIILGFQILKLFPRIGKFQLKMPRKLAHKIHDLSASNHPLSPFLLGAGTFFLPCGFTQGLQLYVLSQGDWFTGAITMLVFSLGTLPALLSLSIISSFAKGKFQKYFLKTAGIIVIMLGIFNIRNGLNLAGITLGPSSQTSARASINSADPNVEIKDGKQIVKMKVDYIDYIPLQFTVYKGMPVEWQIDGRGAVGCTQVITVPRLGITEYLPRNAIKTISFTPENTGEIKFSCSMGMTDPRAKFIVVENPLENNETGTLRERQTTPQCNPEISNCITSQRLFMEISRERGFYPRNFTVKKGVPVELEIDTQIPLGGCMGVMVIPQYNVAHRLALGKSTVKFTPQETGQLPFTCSMGAKLGEFLVVN